MFIPGERFSNVSSFYNKRPRIRENPEDDSLRG